MEHEVTRKNTQQVKETDGKDQNKSKEVITY